MTRTLLRGARVITMSPGRPDAERVDILIDGDRIAALLPEVPEQVREDVERHAERHEDTERHTEVVDLTDRIVIPGLVNAHLHTWQTALRSAGADWTLLGYLLRLHLGVAAHYTPDDMWIGTFAGALNQIDHGTTTLGDWCHNNHTPEHTDAAVRGLRDSGIRAVYLHGVPNRPPDVPHPVAEIDRLLAGAFRGGELLSLGMAVNGPHYSSPEVAVADLRAAEERGLVASMHESGGAPPPAWESVRDAGLFGPRTNIAHGVGLTEDWFRTLVEAGVTFTSTPENELGQGHGTPVTGQLLRLGAAPSLGTDVESVVPGSVLSAARIALAHQRGLDHERRRREGLPAAETPSVTARQALSWATVEGARALGLSDRVGRIAPGMRADLVAIDTRALNLWPAHDPVATVLHADLANIEAVMIAGRWRKRDHTLVGVDVTAVNDALRASGERLLAH
ncbi:amidohydrolase family protein [Streptomyces sp. NPDC101175]|uniref:amidohydrolase family protein n=1 Tax=Streptomyces sp. NPDC101175 TaxID=3366123 RepID=UPI003833A2BC